MLALIGASGLWVSQAFALYDRTKDPLYEDAVSAASKAFGEYAATCNGKTYAKAGERMLLEFSEGRPKVKMFGAFRVSDSDRLNGKLWSGRFEVDAGKAARAIVAGGLGANNVGPWQDTREIEFDLVLQDGQWKISNKVRAWLGYWVELQPGMSCDEKVIRGG